MRPLITINSRIRGINGISGRHYAGINGISGISGRHYVGIHGINGLIYSRIWQLVELMVVNFA